MKLSHLVNRVVNKVFGEDEELEVKEFKIRVTKFRFEVRDWFPLEKDFEGYGFAKKYGNIIKREK